MSLEPGLIGHHPRCLGYRKHYSFDVHRRVIEPVPGRHFPNKPRPSYCIMNLTWCPIYSGWSKYWPDPSAALRRSSCQKSNCSRRRQYRSLSLSISCCRQSWTTSAKDPSARVLRVTARASGVTANSIRGTQSQWFEASRFLILCPLVYSAWHPYVDR